MIVLFFLTLLQVVGGVAAHLGQQLDHRALAHNIVDQREVQHIEHDGKEGLLGL
jgi:hypothetical protein